MTKFFISVLVGLAKNEDVQAVVYKILNKLVTERLAPLFPVLAASAAKSAVDQIIEKVPGLEGVVDIIKVADDARNTLDELIPDIDFPGIGDLTDFWRPR